MKVQWRVAFTCLLSYCQVYPDTVRLPPNVLWFSKQRLRSNENVPKRRSHLSKYAQLFKVSMSKGMCHVLPNTHYETNLWRRNYYYGRTCLLGVTIKGCNQTRVTSKTAVENSGFSKMHIVVIHVNPFQLLSIRIFFGICCVIAIFLHCFKWLYISHFCGQFLSLNL